MRGGLCKTQGDFDEGGAQHESQSRANQGAVEVKQGVKPVADLDHHGELVDE